MSLLSRGLLALIASGVVVGQTAPERVPPKRSSQIQNGFGINSDLPREPYLPWDRWWWTRMFDAGVGWIRIGQYENSSDPTSWDWVERKRGVFAIAPEVDDYVDSLVENGVNVQVQLMYGNPMYTGPNGKKPDQITPEPGCFHNDDRSINSIFWPPKSPDEIAAFTRYVKWMVNHFRGRIKYYALWNEQDIGYWNPWGNPEEYGRLLAAFGPAVHETDPTAKVIYGGQADPVSDWAKRALDACKCASQIDIFAYHTYPGYGRNLNPEAMDHGAYGPESPAKLRDLVRNYPGIRKDIEFWDDEFNSIGSWMGSDETVQAKYVPRGMIYNLAAGVRTFVWLLTAGVDGNEYDDFGLIHGLRNLPDDFTPRPVFYALQNTNALFSDTKFDASVRIETSDILRLAATKRSASPGYGFRNANGKAIVAYWLAAHSVPGGAFAPLTGEPELEEYGHPESGADRRRFRGDIAACDGRREAPRTRRRCRCATASWRSPMPATSTGQSFRRRRADWRRRGWRRGSNCAGKCTVAIRSKSRSSAGREVRAPGSGSRRCQPGRSSGIPGLRAER